MVIDHFGSIAHETWYGNPQLLGHSAHPSKVEATHREAHCHIISSDRRTGLVLASRTVGLLACRLGQYEPATRRRCPQESADPFSWDRLRRKALSDWQSHNSRQSLQKCIIAFFFLLSHSLQVWDFTSRCQSTTDSHPKLSLRLIRHLNHSSQTLHDSASQVSVLLGLHSLASCRPQSSQRTSTSIMTKSISEPS